MYNCGTGKDSSLELSYQWAGSIPFKKSLSLQNQLKERAKKSKFCFLGFESSDSVITLGLRANSSHILWDERKLKSHNLSAIHLKRGGEGTLHCPGQLVIYPILSLRFLGIKVRDFIIALEDITQALLNDFKISTRKAGNFAGLYTARGKICFFGLHISEGVSQHGLSINGDNDLSLFDSIKSCGEAHRSHDKLSFYSGVSISKKDLFLKWCDKAFYFFNRLKPLCREPLKPKELDTRKNSS